MAGSRITVNDRALQDYSTATSGEIPRKCIVTAFVQAITSQHTQHSTVPSKIVRVDEVAINHTQPVEEDDWS